MVQFIVDSFEDRFLMEKAHLLLRWEQLIQVTGNKEYPMEEDNSTFLMEIVIMVCLKMV